MSQIGMCRNGMPTEDDFTDVGTPLVYCETDGNIYVMVSGSVTSITGGGSQSSFEFPVGYVYISTTDEDPATTLGYGTWTQMPGKFLVGQATGDTAFGTVGNTGGAKLVSYTPSGDNAIGLFVPAGTVAWSPTAPSFTGIEGQVSGAAITWPAGVPTFAGTTLSGHQHGLPISHNATAVYFMPTSLFGRGTAATTDVKLTVIGATGTNLVAAVSSQVYMLSQTAGSAVPAGVISWPAGTPQASSVPFTPSGSIAWPSGTPTFAGATGSVSGQVFTGRQTNISILPPYRVVFMWERTA